MTDVIKQLLVAIDRLRSEGGPDLQKPADRARSHALALLHAAVDSLERARA